MKQYSGMFTKAQQTQALGASTWPKIPDAPTIGTATKASGTSVSVTFTAPACVGGGPITSYTATSTPGCLTGTGASSPITVSGLTTGTAYTIKVKATNAIGTGPCSAASNSVTPDNNGQQAYTTPGGYTWVAPAGVTSVSVVAVGGGSGGSPCNAGGAGGLGYRNNITVVPGNSYSVLVGLGRTGNASGQLSYFICGGSSSTGVAACAGSKFGYGGFWSCATASGGGYGGNGSGNGGGGAGGYGPAGNTGGQGGNGGTATAGRCGAGGGGASSQGGGGVGILGQGANGAGGGGGGSGGANASGGNGGAYGGGAGYSSTTCTSGGGGAVRIIWPGTTRAFPSTNTGNL